MLTVVLTHCATNTLTGVAMMENQPIIVNHNLLSPIAILTN